MEVFYISKRKNDNMLINDDIRAKEVRLIGSDGNMIGIVPIEEAKNKAYEQELDLVLIAPQASPPVCRIIDYGKFMFERAKKEKEAKKNQKTITVKEIWMRPKIEEHDFNFKAKNAGKFLSLGNKVKVGIRFRGREMHYTKFGEEILLKFAKVLEDLGEMDRKPKMEGRNMSMFLIPKE